RPAVQEVLYGFRMAIGGVGQLRLGDLPLDHGRADAGESRVALDSCHGAGTLRCWNLHQITGTFRRMTNRKVGLAEVARAPVRRSMPRRMHPRATPRPPAPSCLRAVVGTGPHRTAERCASRATSQSSARSEEHTSELQSRENLVCRLLLEKKNN